MRTPAFAFWTSSALALMAPLACNDDDAQGTGVLERPDKAPFEGEGFPGGQGGGGGAASGPGFGGAASNPSGLASYADLQNLEADYLERLQECGLLGDGTFRAHFDSLPVTACLMECYFELADCGVARNELCGGATTENAAWESCTEKCNQRFDCGNGQTLPANWQCDTYLDCDNGADEEGCGALWFACGDGTPILASQVCDERVQCPNGRDEEDCPAPFSCDAERSIPQFELCDGRTQCTDGSDEANCAPTNCP